MKSLSTVSGEFIFLSESRFISHLSGILHLNSDGYINSTNKIDKVVANNNEPSPVKGPTSLVCKMYGGNKYTDHMEDVLPMNAPSTQLLISYELSRRAWGPKLFGAMENGRIEEYVDSHTLKPAEAFTDEMIAQVTKALACFHSIELPLPKDTACFLRPVKLSFEKEIPAITEWIETADATKECLDAIKFLLNFPFEDEYRWVTSIIAKIQHRQVLSTRDPNYLNRLVKNTKPSSAQETRCMIIDFDFSGYYDRGFDLGGHFVSCLFDPAHKTNKLTGLTYPTKERRDAFLSRYLDECSRVFQDFDPKSLDNMDHLRLETDAYACFYLLWVTFVSAGFYKIYQMEPYMYTIIRYVIDLYFNLKKQFCADYAHLIRG